MLILLISRVQNSRFQCDIYIYICVCLLLYHPHIQGVYYYDCFLLFLFNSVPQTVLLYKPELTKYNLYNKFQRQSNGFLLLIFVCICVCACE